MIGLVPRTHKGQFEHPPPFSVGVGSPVKVSTKQANNGMSKEHQKWSVQPTEPPARVSMWLSTQLLASGPNHSCTRNIVGSPSIAAENLNLCSTSHMPYQIKIQTCGRSEDEGARRLDTDMKLITRLAIRLGSWCELACWMVSRFGGGAVHDYCTSRVTVPVRVEGGLCVLAWAGSFAGHIPNCARLLQPGV